MDDSDLYRSICADSSKQVPLFQQAWWLETVCPDRQWSVLLAKKEGEVVAAMPYFLGRKYGLRYILEPQLTPYSGIWIEPSLRNSADGKRATEDIVAQLEALRPVLYLQRYPVGFALPHPFTDRKYKIEQRYTYRFEDISDIKRLRANASRVRRRGLDEVARRYSIDREMSAEEFSKMHIAYWTQRSGKDILSKSLITRVCNTALSRKQALLYCLRDKEEKPVSACFIIFDRWCAYYLLSANSSHALPNAQTFLLWTMIEELSKYTHAFDFEGSMESGVALFFRTFGATKTPLLQITRCHNPLIRYYLHRKQR